MSDKKVAVGRVGPRYNDKHQKRDKHRRKDSSSSDDCDKKKVCCIADYNKELIRRYYETLRVSAVFDPETATRANSPFIFVEDGEVRGASIDLLRKMAARIPCVKHIEVVPKPDADTALEEIRVGEEVLDITPLPITRANLDDTLAALAIDIGTGGTSNNQLLFYSNGPVCRADSNVCSVFNIATGSASASEILTNIANSSGVPPDPMSPECPIARAFVSPTNTSGINLLEAANATVPAGQPGIVLEALPPFTTLDQLTALLEQLISGPNLCNTVVLVPNTFTPAEFAALLAAFPAFGTVPPESLTGFQFALLPLQQSEAFLALGWYFLKFASPHFGLWLQRAFDEVVASGKYRKILARYGLTTPTLPENPLISPVAIPPRYYSIEQGFIPRVAVAEAFLPKLTCVEDAHQVDVVLIDETTVDGDNNEENNV